ncbi:hypothetical protein EMIT0P100_120120 [Pseudomonas sp. IT-P100]
MIIEIVNNDAYLLVISIIINRDEECRLQQMSHANIRCGELHFIILWFCRLFSGGFFLHEGIC